MARDLAIVLNNGSLNSVVTTALAAQRFRPILVYGDYASGTALGSRAAYDQQVAHFKPYREHTLPMGFLAPMLAPGEATAQAADPRHTALLGPQLLRLLPIVSAGAVLAAHYQAAAIYLGLRAGGGADELAQATEFVQVVNELLQLPCRQAEIEVITPLLELEAWQVVDVGFQVQAPMERGWSCMEEGAAPCGACRGCRGREAAFGQAGRGDPMGRG